jgi:hypothetical protein
MSEWDTLRTWENSKNLAFEELCCQLAHYDKPANGVEFIRKGGGGDAGVECYWKLNDGSEYAWQAKYFLSSSQVDWTQLDDSVKAAIEKHPKLVRYTVCLPIDRSNARVAGQKSMLDHWVVHVEKWSNWSQAKNMTVAFEYWGKHELFGLLFQEPNRGRYYFWFNEELFTDQWFSARVGSSVADATASRRYVPELNINLPIAKYFEALGRTQKFYAEIYSLHKNLRKRIADFTFFLPSSLPEVSEILHPVNELCTQLLDALDSIDTASQETIAFDRWNQLCLQLIGAIQQASDAIKLLIQDLKQKSENNDRQDRVMFLPYDLYQLSNCVRELQELADSRLARVANTPALLIVGEGGIGKTHLFCSVAEQRMLHNLPTLLLLGEKFQNGEPLAQLVKLVGDDRNTDEFLGALNTAAEVRNTKCLILIDGLNEADDISIWHKFLGGMLHTLVRYPRISIAISVRSPYESFIIPDSLIESNKLIRQEHIGFVGLEDQAVRKYFEFFGIDYPNTPPLAPEFRNPLFLQILCRGLENEGLQRVPVGLHGITKIFEFYLKSVDKKLASKLNYNPNLQLVKKAVDELISVMANSGIIYIPEAQAQTIVDQILPNRAYTESLYYHMIAEGILTRTMPDRNKEEVIRFLYDRFTDHLIVNYLLETHLDATNLQASFAEGTYLAQIFTGDSPFAYRYGFITALATQIPENVSKELPTLAPYLDNDRIFDAVLSSIVWRNWTSLEIPKELLDYINKFVVTDRYHHDKFWETVISLAANPDNPFNADFLHRNLITKELAQRDAIWSVFLHEHFDQSDESPSSINRLINWAWSEQHGKTLTVDVVRLAGKGIAWMLTIKCTPESRHKNRVFISG